MALTKVGSGGIENVTNAANATFLTIDASEQITVASEGVAVTTSVQQGLAKAWLNYNQSTPVIDDSFNITSVADNSAGNFTPTITNVFSNAHYTLPSISTAMHIQQSGTPTTSTYTLQGKNQEGNATDGEHSGSFHGDLA